MNQNLRVASDFYRLARGRKPAVKMLVQSVVAMSLIVVWASLAPISETVVHSVKIVPKRHAMHLVDGSMTPSSSVSGQVIAVLVKELSSVRKGDVLARLDSGEFSIRREGEVEKIACLEREIESKALEEQLASATHEARKAELLAQINLEKQSHQKLVLERSIRIRKTALELKRLEKDLSRTKKLSNQRAISSAELDMVKADFLRAKEELELAKLPLSESRVAEIESRIEAASSGYKEVAHQIVSEKLSLSSSLAIARNQVAILDLKISQCEIFAPVSGNVSTCDIRVGDWIAPGEISLTISQRGFMAEGLLPSRLIGGVKRGDRATITLDGIDLLINGSLEASVTEISPELCQEEVVAGDGSSHIVDGYRVLMELERNGDFEKWNSVRIGMTGSVEIETGTKKLATYLVEKAFGDDWLPSN